MVAYFRQFVQSDFSPEVGGENERDHDEFSGPHMLGPLVHVFRETLDEVLENVRAMVPFYQAHQFAEVFNTKSWFRVLRHYAELL
jgi:hypothetical protein